MHEISVDEIIEEPLKRMKVEVCFQVIPWRLTCHGLTHEYFFFEGILKLSKDKEGIFKFSAVQDLCEYYNLHKQIMIDKLETLTNVYKIARTDIHISDTCLLYTSRCV